MKNLFLLLSVLAFPLISYSQCAERGLYALLYASGTNHIIFYNETTGNIDTIMEVPGTFNVIPSGAGIDAYNGRIFLTENSGNGYRIVIIDLNNKSITRSAIYSGTIGGIQYDMFGNRLVISDGKRGILITYDIVSDTYNDICLLPQNRFQVIDQIPCFDAAEQQYYAPADSLIFKIDINSKQVTDSINTVNRIYFQTFDFLNEKIIGVCTTVTPGSLNKVVVLDINTGKVDSSTILNGKHSGTIGLQMAAFDASDGHYYFPCYINPPGFAVIEVIDVYTGTTVKTIDNYFDAKFQQFHGLYSPVIKQLPDSSLIATYGKSYQWFCNGNKIEGATSQIFKPMIPGNYTAIVNFSCCRQDVTNEIYMDVPAVKKQVEQGKVLAYNNPADGDVTIIFNNPDKQEHNLFIYDGLGQVIAIYRKVSANFINIRKGELASGMYYYKLYRLNSPIGSGRILVL